jgi:EAL domain-containing protein (putative c-di-GMP-specific phosphodiesterase class I)
MAPPGPDQDRFREFAFAAADLLISTDATGEILDAAGDARLLHHPSTDRLVGQNALELISEGGARHLREQLWALRPGRRISWDDPESIEGGRRIVIQRRPAVPDSFSLVVSRIPHTTAVHGDRADDVLLERFRDTVMNGRLRAACQPIVDARTGAVSHYEVLARFEGEESPLGLIVAAERGGQICHLDYVMVSAAAARLTKNTDPAYRLAVNISGESIQRLDVIRELCALISGHQFRRARLIVEITESARIHDIEAAAEAVRCLRACGISVSLDDFGAGATSFGYLRALDVDGLKFDGSFLQAHEDNLRSVALMRSVARMCMELGIVSVGERVETETDRQRLLEAGVRYAQGYLFGAPAIDETFFERGAKPQRRAA